MNSYRWAALIFLVFAIATYLSGQFATSVVPGWHTSIYTPLAVASMAMSVWIFLLAIFYMILNIRKPMSNKNIGLHVLFTIIPFFIFENQHNWLPQRNEADAIFSFIILVAICGVFAIAQLWFVLLVTSKLAKQSNVV